MFLIVLLLMLFVVGWTFFHPSLTSIALTIVMIAFAIITAFITSEDTRLREAFKDVRLINEDTCEYSKDPHWLKIPATRRYLWIHRALGLCKKVELAKKHYDEVVKEAKNKLYPTVIRDIWDKLNFRIVPWNGKGIMPSHNWFWCEKMDGKFLNYHLITTIIKNSPLQRVDQSDGRILLVGDSPIAGTDTKGKREGLIVLIQALRNDEETKKLVRMVDDAKDAAEKAFKEKFAKIVHNLRLNTEGLK